MGIVSRNGNGVGMGINYQFYIHDPDVPKAGIESFLNENYLIKTNPDTRKLIVIYIRKLR